MNRRGAIIGLLTAAGVIPSDVMIGFREPGSQALPKVTLLVDLERFDGITYSLKGQTVTITPESILEALK